MNIIINKKSIDINKLSFEELKLIISIIENQEKYVYDDKIRIIKEIKKERVGELIPDRRSKETMYKIKKMMEENKITFNKAFYRVVGAVSGGEDYKTFYKQIGIHPSELYRRIIS